MFTQQKMTFNLGLLLATIAGIWTIVHIILAFAGNTTNIYWNEGLIILFVLALILAFVQYAEERTDLKKISTTERFPEPTIARFFTGSTGSSPLWFVVRMFVGAEWFLAGYEKVISPAWGTSGKAIAGFVAGALAKTSGANPSVQGWYASFLQNFVQPNAG
ncbi:MAG TPA: hypothetical protein VFN23_18180, partial [Ktedonobacteraceae bacterium]|nr:hypothetical protein [Ktedonobacteraceae bacterium]